jgi:hypothetical protein
MPSPIERLHDALQTDHPQAFTAQPGAILTSWIIIAEYANPDGTLELCRTNSQGLPTWRRTGMLQTILNDDQNHQGDWNDNTEED